MTQILKLIIKFLKLFLEDTTSQESVISMVNSTISNKDIPTSKTAVSKCNQAGIDLIKRMEGFRSTPYYCSANKLTIGYGHVILEEESYSCLKEAEAETILKSDVKIAENAINQYIDVYLAPNQFSALVSLVFNIGITAFKRSSLRIALNNNKFDEVPYRIRVWNKITKDGRKVKSAGLVKRRGIEVKLWLA